MQTFTNKTNSNSTVGMKTWLISCLMIVLVFSLPIMKVNGQANITNYSFNAGTNGSLEDVSVGATTLLSGNNDDAATAVSPIGFEFVFMGVPYTHFSANSNGQFRFHTSAGATAISGSNIASLAASTVTLAPFSGDNEVNNGIHYKLLGSPGTYKLVLEWREFYVNFVNLTNAGNMQLWLDQATGSITYIYGEIYNSNTSSQTRSIFISSSNTATTAGSITIGNPNTYAASATLVSNTIAAGANPVGAPLIANIGSASQGSRVFFTWTPPATGPTAPANISFTAITQTAMTVNWEDASTNEAVFVVTRATDAGFTQNVVSTSVNSTTTGGTGTSYNSVQSGLAPGITYYYRVIALNEGKASSALTGNQVTNPPGNIVSTGTGGNWSVTGTWVGGVVPTAIDNVTIADGATVTIDNATPVCLNLTVGQGTSGILTWVGGTSTATLTVNGNITVAANGTFNGGAGTGAKTLRIGGSTAAGSLNGNLTVDGVFNMVASVTTTFFGSLNGTISGSGATCNFGPIVVNKGTSNASILDVTRVITQLAPAVSANWLTITAGTFKLSSASAITPYFGTNTICASIGRLWLNNASASVQCVGTGTATGAGTPTVGGTLQIDAGTFGYGSGNNTLAFTSGSGILNMSGGTLNMFGAITFPSSAGTQFIMSGGNINVDAQAGANLASGTSQFTINGSTTVNWSGGTITIVDPHAASGGTAFTALTGGTKSVTGGTLRIGDGVSTTTGGTFANTSGFGLNIAMPIWNLEINNRTDASTSRMARMVGNVNVLNSVDIASNAYLFVGTGVSATFYLNFSGSTFTNNGTLSGAAVGASLVAALSEGGVFFNGTAAQTLAGTGSFVEMNTLFIDNDNGVTLTQTNQLNALRVFLLRGGLTGANKLTIGLNSSLVSAAGYGTVATAPGVSGNFDVAPNFNTGAGGIQIFYAPENSARTTGVEIPAGRSIVNMSIQNTNGVTVAGGNLTITGTLSFVTGKLNTSSSNLVTVTGTAVGSISGFSANNYVNGPIARNLPASLASELTYTWPVGKGGYNPLQLVNPTTNAGGPVTIVAEVFDGNAGGTAGNLMGSINSTRYWQTSTADGAANFTNSLLRLNDTRGTQDGIANSATVNGTYDHVGGTVSTLAAGSITTTAPELTSISGFYLMGNLAAPVLSNLAITPTGNQCTNVLRTVTVTATPGGSPVATVTLNYQVNGGSVIPVSMTNTSGNEWSGVIPTVTPANADVTWSVVAVDNNSLQASATGTAYKDEPLFAVTVTAAAVPTSVCSGSPTVLTGTINQPSPAVTLGAGATVTTGTLATTPFLGGWGGGKTQYLVRASELTALGFTAGNITKLGVDLTSVGSTLNGFAISIGNTALTALTTNIEVVSTSVYGPVTFAPVSGINTFTFSTPFNWDGSSNIIVSFCWSNANTTNTVSNLRGDNPGFVAGNARYVDSRTAAEVCSYTGNTLPSGWNGNSTTASFRPKFIFEKQGLTFNSTVWNDGTSDVGFTNPYTANPTSNTSYTFTATESVSGCSKTSAAVPVTTIALPSGITSVSEIPQCGIGVPTSFVTGGVNGNYRWYLTPTGGTALANEFNSALQNYSISTTTTFYVSITDGTCESLRSAVVATVNPPDAVEAQVSNNNPCRNTEITLTAAQTGNSQNYTYTWSVNNYSGSGLTEPVQGASINVTPTLAGTYIYTVNAVDGACATSSQISVTVKDLPNITTTTATPSTICAGANVVLAATAGTLGTGNVTFGAGALSATGAPGPFYHLYGGAKVQMIYTKAELNAAGLTGGNITALALQLSALGSATVTRNNFTIHMGHTSQSTAVVPLITSGLSQVYANAALSLSLGVNTYTFDTPFNWNNTDNVVVSICWTNNNSGNSSASPTFLYDALPTSQTSYIYADNSSQALLLAAAVSGTPLGTSTAAATVNRPKVIFTGTTGEDNTAFTNWSWNNGGGNGSSVTVNPTTTTLYTVTATDQATLCSNTATVNVTVNPVPTAPDAVGSFQCGAIVPTASVSTTSGTETPTFKWYTVPTGGTAVQTSTSNTYLASVAATTSFYVSEISAFGCEGPRTEVTVTVTEPDVVTATASSNTICIGGSVDLSADHDVVTNSYNFTWTASPSVGSGLESPDGNQSLTVTPTAPGTYIYTVTAVDEFADCSTFSTVTVTVRALPVINAASATPSTACAGSNVTLLATTETIGSGNVTFGAGASTATTVPNPYYHLYGGVKMQYIYTKAELNAAGLTGGDITALALQLSALGSATVTRNNFTIHMGHTTQSVAVTPLITSGLSQVYSNAAQAISLGVNNYNFSTPFNWNNTDNVVVSICWTNNNSGNSSATPTIVHDVLGATQTAYIYADNSSQALLLAAGISGSPLGTSTMGVSPNRAKLVFTGQTTVQGPGSFTWSWNNGGGSGNSVVVTPTTTTTYIATATDAFNCSSDSDPVLVTVNPVPDAPSSNSPVTRCGAGPVTLTANGSGGTLNWYNVPTGGTSLQTGGTYTPNVTASTSFWVSETNEFNCAGPRTEVSVIVTAPPTLVITPATSATFCLGGSVALNAATGSDPSYDNFTWEATPATGSGLSANSGAGITVEPTIAGTYQVQVTASNPDGCINTATISVVANPNPLITSVTAQPATICSGGSSALVAQSIPAAAGTATIGAGASTLANVYNAPFYTLWSNKRMQVLIRANELSASGLVAGPITTLGFPTTAGTLAMADFSIKLGNTATTDVSTFITTGLVPVYSVASQPQVANTNNTITLQNAFSWDGTSNLIIELCFGNSGSSATMNSTSVGDATSYVSVIKTHVSSASSGAAVCSNTASNLATFSSRPRVLVGGQIGVDLTNTLTWNWTPGNIGGSVATVSPTTTQDYFVTATNAFNCSITTTTPVTVSVLPVSANATANPATPVCAGTAVVLSSGGIGGEPLTYSWSDGGPTVYPATSSITVNPTVTTTYTVTVTDACNNPTTSQVTVTVNPLPTVTVTPSTASFCNPGGTPVTLEAAGAISYTWAPAAGLSATTGSTVNASPTANTTYVVTGTDANNCLNTASAVITVNPNVVGQTATATPNPICVGSTLTLNANATPIPGYTMNPNSAVAFIDISGTGTSVGTLADDSEHNISVPSIVFNGVTYTTARVGNNGGIALGSTTGDIGLTNAALPTGANTAGNVLLLPFWDDLDIQTGATCHTQTVGNKFIIQYTNQSHDAFTTGSITYQVQYDLTTSQIHFVYQDVIFGSATYDGGASATVGIQWANAAGSFIQYSFNTASLVNGQSITFTPTSFNYSWTGPDGFASTEKNPTIPNVSLAAAGVYSVVISTNAGCSATANTSNVVVNPRATGVISGDAIYPVQTSTPLSIAVTGTGPWSGTLAPGNIPFSGSSSPITVNVSPAFTTTYTIATLVDEGVQSGGCASIAGDLTGSATITVVNLAAPTFSVIQPTCAVATGTITVTAPLTSGFEYSIDGNNYQPSNVFSGVAPGTYSVTFKDLNNFISPAASATVNPQPFIPAAPTMTGIVNVCPFVGTGTELTYTASAAGATSYTWTLPPLVTLVSSTSGNASITVRFETGFIAQVNKQLRVRANSICGTSPIGIYYLQAQYPNTPAPISGPTNVCPFLGVGSATYSVPEALGAASYIWTAQAGVVITPAGPGPLGNTVSVEFPVGFTTSAITVQAVNECGVSGIRSITVTRATPSTPSPISGPTNVCEFIAPNGTAATYSVPLQPGVDTYTWTLPGGATSITGQGTNTISFIYPSGYTGGSISVVATNGCGTSVTPRTLAVSRLNPATPSVIDVIQTGNCPERVYTYTLAALPANATSILWTIPVEGTLVSGQGTTSISVSYPATAVSGTVTATAVNNCGTSVTRSVSVKLAACPPPPEFSKGTTVTPVPTMQVDVMDVKVFPNPSVSDFKLQVQSASKELIHVRILDMTGREYKLLQMMAGETLSLGGTLKPGSYLIEVRQGKQLKTTKVLKF